MFVNISIHRLHADKEKLLIESIHRYGEAAKHRKGLISVHTLKDENAGELVGTKIWDSRESFLAPRPAPEKAVEGDDFDAREKEPIRATGLLPDSLFD